MATNIRHLSVDKSYLQNPAGQKMGQLPISAVPTSASVHDSQVAIPLMTLTSGRVTHLYELMDSAYDADSIHAHSRQLNHVPIIAPHPRRGTKKPSQTSALTKTDPLALA